MKGIAPPRISGRSGGTRGMDGGGRRLFIRWREDMGSWSRSRGTERRLILFVQFCLLTRLYTRLFPCSRRSYLIWPTANAHNNNANARISTGFFFCGNTIAATETDPKRNAGSSYAGAIRARRDTSPTPPVGPLRPSATTTSSCTSTGDYDGATTTIPS